MKSGLRATAITLRQQGLSYTEILQQVPVAKSTLSLWLRSIGLSKSQKQRLTHKKLSAAYRGGQSKREQRMLRILEIKKVAHHEVEKLSEDILWIMGVMLYWCEGAKDKDYKPGQSLSFSSSDVQMVKVFLAWLRNSLKMSENMIILDICVNENNKYRLEEIKKYWSEATGFNMAKFDRIYFRKQQVNSSRKNTGKNSYGQLRIRVRESSVLNRKVTGWIEGLCLHCGIV